MRPALPLLRALALVAAAAACGVRPEDAPLAVDVDGAPLASEPDYLRSPTLVAETRAVAAAAAVAWGAPASATAGWRVVFSPAPFACGDASADRVVGCTDGAAQEVRILAYGAACPAATALPHELGHVVIGDPRHGDRRWCDRAFWAAMRDALAAATPSPCDLSRFVAANVSGCGERDGDDDEEDEEGGAGADDGDR